MYILVLFNEKKSIKLPRSRRREGVCQVLRNTIFFKETEKNTRLRLVEARIK